MFPMLSASRQSTEQTWTICLLHQEVSSKFSNTRLIYFMQIQELGALNKLQKSNLRSFLASAKANKMFCFYGCYVCFIVLFVVY